ncbi:MAG: hypothetical protein Q8S13_02680 [Dehalococcoidia bacterium]|nr:hypothetical protein [Dehalococcoidia bacterium]
MTPTEASIIAKIDELQIGGSSLALRMEHIEKHLQDFDAGLKSIAELHALVEEIKHDVETVGMMLGGRVPGRGLAGESEGDAPDTESSRDEGNGEDGGDASVFDKVLSREEP